jgi:histidinol-phosphate aminotransferase
LSVRISRDTKPLFKNRLGVSYASKDITQIFNNTKAPYNISTPTSLIGKSAVSDDGWKQKQDNIDAVLKQRDHVLEQLSKLKRIGRILGKSHANFILVEILNQQGAPCNEIALKVYKDLAEHEGVVVRFRGNELGCFGCLRITVGTEKENHTLLIKLEKLLV